MLRRLFAKPPSPSALPGVLALGKRLYAIGDVHGEAGLLERLLGVIRDDAQGFEGEITVVFLGDLIDRGPRARDVLRMVRTALPTTWKTVFLMGNHEHALLAFLDDPEGAPHWLAWGGDAVLADYDIAQIDAGGGRRGPHVLAADMRFALEEEDSLAFIRSFVPYHVEDGYLFVHAGVRPNLALGHQVLTDMLFIRDDFTAYPHALPYRVVYGHTVAPEPVMQEDRLGLDTGAYCYGVLTAAVLEGTTTRLLQVCEPR